MRLRLHGIFARDYGDEVTIHAGSAAEAIEAFSRQVGFYEDRLIADRPVVRVVGFESAEDLACQIDDNTDLHLVPAMFGGGGNFGRILIGAALVGLAFVPGVGTAFSIALGAGLGSITAGGILLAVGGSLLLSGVSGLFMKAPTTSKSADPPASKYLGGAALTTAIGTPIAFCLGTVRLAGQVLSYDVTSNTLSFAVFPSTPS